MLQSESIASGLKMKIDSVRGETTQWWDIPILHSRAGVPCLGHRWDPGAHLGGITRKKGASAVAAQLQPGEEIAATK